VGRVFGELMPLLRDTRCPQCDSGLPLKVLWEFSRSSSYDLVRKSGVLRGRIGIVCPNCGAKLRIVQTRIRVFLFLLWAIAFGGAWFVGEWMRHAHVVLNRMSQVLGLVVLGTAIVLLQKYCIPHLAQVRLAGADEQLGFPLSGAYGNQSDSQESQDAKSAASDEPFERR
jgi:DNA-directed RNA polymerase subunit RPC12/RpoP